MKTFDSGRRNFITSSGFSALCFVCGAGLSTMVSACDTIEEGPPIIDLAQEPRLHKPGGGIRKRFALLNNGEAIFVIRESETRFLAYAAQCTHQGVELNLPNNGAMKCPNHGSRFRTSDGTVIDGTAYQPLRRFDAVYDKEKNTVTIS